MLRGAGIEREFANRAEQRVLRLFGHAERMNENRLDRRVLMAEVSGWWVQGRPRLNYMNGMKGAMGNKGMIVVAALQCVKIKKSGEPWCKCN